MLDDLPPDERRIAFIQDPLEFVSAPSLEQDTRDIDSDGQTGGESCLDMFDGYVGGQDACI